MIFGHAVIAWIFFLIFYYCKILNFGLLKVRFRRKKQKDVKDDGTSSRLSSSGSADNFLVTCSTTSSTNGGSG